MNPDPRCTMVAQLRHEQHLQGVCRASPILLAFEAEDREVGLGGAGGLFEVHESTERYLAATLARQRPSLSGMGTRR